MKNTVAANNQALRNAIKTKMSSEGTTWSDLEDKFGVPGLHSLILHGESSLDAHLSARIRAWAGIPPLPVIEGITRGISHLFPCVGEFMGSTQTVRSSLCGVPNRFILRDPSKPSHIGTPTCDECESIRDSQYGR